MKIKYPIIVGTSGDLWLFDSIHTLTTKLDPTGVIKDSYDVYDGDGHRLCLLTTKREGEPGYGVAGEDEIRIERAEKLPADEDSVRKLFLDYFDRKDIGGAINRKATLEDLLKLFVISYGYTR